MMSDKTIDFSPGSQARKIVKMEFESDKWNQIRQWILESYDPVELKTLSNEFYDLCEQKNKILNFVPWFIYTYIEKYISVLERNYRINTDRNIMQDYSVSFQNRKNNIRHSFNNIAELLDDDTFNIICQQINDCADLYLDEQIGSLQNRINRLIKVIKTQNNKTEESVEITTQKIIEMDIANQVDTMEISTSSIQSPDIVTNSEFMNDLEKFLEEQIKELELTTLDINLRMKLFEDSKLNYQDQVNNEVNNNQINNDLISNAQVNDEDKIPIRGKDNDYPKPTQMGVLIEKLDYNNSPNKDQNTARLASYN